MSPHARRRTPGHAPRSFLDPDNPNALVWADFERDLKVLGRSPRTIQSYRESAEQLSAYLDYAAITDLDTDDVTAYLSAVGYQHSDATKLVRFRALRRFYNWAVREEWIETSPMARMSLPSSEEKLIPVPAADDIRALLKTCSGRTFDDLRDTAIIRLFCEPGAPRISEMAGLKVADVDLVHDQVLVLGKGAKWRHVPFSARTGKAISRYARERAKHELSRLDGFWLGSRGQVLTVSGIYQMVERRSKKAGIGHLHPHQFRHYAADLFLGEGGSEQDAMRLFGWDSTEMPRRYGRANATARAIESARKLALGDRL